MSFEAVPCMFKSRQEDGNEAQLFGLLIRPSPTTAQTQQSAPPPGVLPIAALTAGPSTIQIVPTSSSSSPSSDNGTKKGLPVKDGRAVFSRCGSALFNTNSTTSNGVASTAAALFASGTSNGMPPILPRPKNGKTMARLSQQQQLMRSLVQLPTKTTSTLAFEMAQSSPQQIVSQLASTAISLENCEALSVSTASSSSSSSSGCSSSSTPSLLCSSVSAFPSQPIASTASSNNANGLLTIHSPPQKAKPQKAAGEKPATTLKTPRRRRSRQTLASEGTAQREEGNGASSSTARSNSGTETDNAGGGADLLGDLHSIEYSQLVNSSVITTEDYLPSQSDPIYTNMDMYSASSLSAAHLQQQNGQLKSEQRQQKQQTADAEKNAASPAAIVAPSLCPSAIFIHNQQHHQQPLLGQSHHSSVRFVPSAGGSAAVPPPPSQQQPHPSHWHPYMGAHPGGPSHISSTPDSGIQSIDGSPPSVYTPPMVSPYASQVRSCESVNNGIHCGMPSSSSAICATVGGILPNPSSCSSAPSFYGTSAYSSLTEESLTITTFNPSSSSSLFLSSSLNVPPSLIIEQFAEGENGDGETANDQSQRRQMLGQQQQGEDGEEEDFSDMPKLVPVTHSEHDEEVVEQQDQFGPGTSATVPAAEDDGKRGTAQPLFHPGMSLHELAECLSSNISREQLKQLTSLIQRKAEEQKNNLEEGGNERREEKRTNEEKEKEEDKREQQKEEQQQHQQRKITEEEREREKKEEEEKGGEERKRGTKRSKTNSEVSSGAKRREEAVGRVEEGEEAGEGKEGKTWDGRGGDDEAERKARDLEQLAIYRSRVRQQLNRKLTALLERVIRRMDKCHLNLSPIGGTAEFSQKGWPWKKMNWEEIHRRAEARGEEWMMPTMAKGRGRKRKSGREEDEGKEEEVSVGRRAGEKKRVNGERSVRDTKRERKVKKRNSEEKHGEEDQTKKRVTRKRRGREEDGETEKQTKRMHDERGGQEEKREEPKKEEKQEKNIQEERRERNEKREEAGEREEKQNTPPIILRIRPPTAKPTALTTIKRMTAPRAATGKTFDCASATVAKRRKPSSSPKPSCSFSSPAAVLAADNSLRERCHSNAAFSTTDGGRKSTIGGRRWTTTTTGRRTTKGGGGGTTPREGQQQHNGSTPRPRRTRRRRMEMPSQEHILSDRERTIVHSTRCFLIRNLSRRRRIGKGTSTQCQQTKGMEVTKVLERLLTHFCAIIDHCFVSDRQLDELIRTVKLMLSSIRDPSALLARFDSLLKQFIASSLPNSIHHNESINSQYAQMKQSIDFGKLKCSVPKETLSAFLDEDRLRSLSASSNKRDTFHRPLTVDTSIDLSYLDSPHPVGQWDPDKAAKLSPTSDNRDHDCVRCICGIAEDDGVMSQCDRCHFWLHADCLDCPVLDDQQEFVCDFCTRRIETTPRVDIVLKPQPTLKLSGCNYYRTLVNSRGLQVRLNESVYVERLINDKHKSILRELHEECVRKQQLAHSAQQSPQKRGRGSVGKRKSGGKVAEKEQKEGKKDEERTTKSEANRWWPEQTDDDAGDEAENDGSRAKASTSSGMGMTPVGSEGTNPTGNNGTQPFRFHRRDLRVFRIERLFCSPNGHRFIFGCYYARPHETFCDSSRTFYRNELFWTPLFDTLPLDSVVGRCLVLEPQIWAMGRPKSPRYLEDDVFVCEYQIDRNQRSFEKIPPKNRYYINTEPFVFNFFEKKLTMKRDFTPFKITASSTENKTSSSSTASRTDCCCTTTSPLFTNSLIRQRILQQNLESVCSKISAQKIAVGIGTSKSIA